MKPEGDPNVTISWELHIQCSIKLHMMNSQVPPVSQASFLRVKFISIIFGIKMFTTSVHSVKTEIVLLVSHGYDLVLCARCYVPGNYQVGVTASEFRRVEISEPVKAGWTEKETLQLLEAVMHYRDDWKRVAEQVGGRTDTSIIHHSMILATQLWLREATLTLTTELPSMRQALFGG
ncbi:SWI/SNF and RSC complexes subunit ssr2 isoform X2 [Spinacia oleracea]|uniref:SWI/SNF and RSC complexes subunit ssr2 isoform X2 n=1 Tax=Spinacia oleracea TaxID=3562 RepID=A0A9R0J2F6_SPIOL|nr:SWI/SNF and RSC complexes subunit ssr2-like isoform X2 [Spinacia oleracea]